MDGSNSNLSVGPSIEDLPEEVLEFILSLISPYKDLHNCMLVSKKWRKCVLNVVKMKQRNFQKSINEFEVVWKTVTPHNSPPISSRYSHSAVVYDNFMYVFGGCTNTMTTFNDLWRLDLSTRTWMRPLATGSNPSPKACSSLVRYKNFLVLFGGWTYPPSYPLYQNWNLFDELHLYDITANKWTCIDTLINPPPIAAHSASVVGQFMIIFGGLKKTYTAEHSDKSNDIWALNLKTWAWYKPPVEAGPKPCARFGQTQVVLDDKNLLILGGTGGPTSQFSDCWILNLEGRMWKWIKVEIGGKQNEPANIWSNPGCKVGDKIVVINRIRSRDESPIIYYPKSQWNQIIPFDGRLSRIDLAHRIPDIDENVNGRRGTLRNIRRGADGQVEGDAGPSNVGYCNEIQDYDTPSVQMLAFFQPSQRNIHRYRNINHERRLGQLQSARMKYIKKEVIFPKKEKRGHCVGIYVLDISQVLSEKPVATWLPPKNVNNGPEETILYTLVKGKSELVMFGGILRDSNSLAPCNLSSQISSSLHFITAPDYVI